MTAPVRYVQLAKLRCFFYDELRENAPNKAQITYRDLKYVSYITQKTTGHPVVVMDFEVL